MKKFALMLCFIFAAHAFAQDGTQMEEKKTHGSAEIGNENSAHPLPDSASKVSEKEPSAGQNPIGNMPFGLGNSGLLQSGEILSALNSHLDLKDITGKKIDDAQAKLLRARFEKYLSTPVDYSDEEREYNKLLVDINQRLLGKGGGSVTARTIDAWKMLFKAQDYAIDNQLCRTIADKVINFWQTTRKTESLLKENERLERDRARRESSMITIQTRDRREFIDVMRDNKATPPPTREFELDPLKKRLMETEKKIEENKSYEVSSRVSQKMDFQSLIIQFFVQRRYYHAMIANDFYRYLFEAEDAKLDGLDSIKTQVFGGADIKLTTSTIDALCKEAVSDTLESVKAADYLVSKGEIHSAAQRLMEAFFIGENLAEVKMFPAEKKREILRYMRDADKLVNAVKVKHVERAESILKDMSNYVSDFDSGQIEAFIQTSKQLSDLALQKALVAAQTGNRQGVDAALQEAVEFWPTNPKIQEFLKTMLGKIDLKDVATLDFDRLLAQKDYRGIFNDRFRFAAALAMDSARNGEFLEIMKRMEAIETSMAQAKELSRLHNNYAAWEILEKVYQKFPEDAELSRLRSDFTVKASSLAAVLTQAAEADAKGDKWEALLSYVRASKIYPMSSIANDNISRLANEILAEKSANKN